MIAPERLTVIVNTGDDEEFYGLCVCPDVDTMIYTLADLAPPSRGWGIAGDTHATLHALARFHHPQWFALGDRDLATHLVRSDKLRSGVPLHRVTAEIARAFGVRSSILPMSSDRVRTFVRTLRAGWLPFQTYFVKRRARDGVVRLAYRGQADARPAPGVLDAIRGADALLLPPSNPFTSIRPILGLRGVESVLRERRAISVAVSPIRGGRAIRGPLARMVRAHGLSVSPVAIAELYRGLIDGIVIDRADRRFRPRLESMGLRVAVTDIRMESVERSVAVARVALELAGSIGTGPEP